LPLDKSGQRIDFADVAIPRRAIQRHTSSTVRTELRSVCPDAGPCYSWKLSVPYMTLSWRCSGEAARGSWTRATYCRLRTAPVSGGVIVDLSRRLRSGSG
jgi:hypothetical protein